MGHAATCRVRRLAGGRTPQQLSLLATARLLKILPELLDGHDRTPGLNRKAFKQVLSIAHDILILQV